jgi:heat shock protein HtpX
MLKAEESAKKGKTLSWDEFFNQLLNRGRKKRDLKSWIYTIGIFVAITFILMIPLYVGAPLAALAMLPVFILIGLMVAFFSAYVLTSWTLRGIKPFDNAPPEVLKSFAELSTMAGLQKEPKLMIAETDEINAMAYVSLSGNRVCVTRGLMNAYQSGKIEEDELNAILGHEIGHIKNRDCLKWSFVLSWVSIFDMVGTVCIFLGTAISGIGIALGVGASRGEGGIIGLVMALFGWVLLILGFIQKLIAKIASILAFHLSRKHEHAADMVGAELTSPGKMASALQRINALNKELVAKELAKLPYADRWQLQPCNPSWIDKLFDTHPPMEKRETELRTISTLF